MPTNLWPNLKMAMNESLKNKKLKKQKQKQKAKKTTDVKIFLIIYISVVSLYLKYHFLNESIFYLDYLQM